MGCGMNIVKFTLFLFNLVCALGGIAMIVLGVSILYKYDVVLDVIKDSHAEVIPIVFIAIGSAIFLIAFFGCCGAIFESECMMLTYSVLLFLLLVTQIVVGVLVFTNQHEAQRIVERIMNQFWRDRQAHQDFWDVIQRLFHCCGLNSSNEWSPYVPKSCCEIGVSDCVPMLNTYNSGCSAEVKHFISDSSVWFGTTAFIIASVELIGFIFACCLSNHIRNYKRRLAY